MNWREWDSAKVFFCERVYQAGRSGARLASMDGWYFALAMCVKQEFEVRSLRTSLSILSEPHAQKFCTPNSKIGSNFLPPLL